LPFKKSFRGQIVLKKAASYLYYSLTFSMGNYTLDSKPFLRHTLDFVWLSANVSFLDLSILKPFWWLETLRSLLSAVAVLDFHKNGVISTYKFHASLDFGYDSGICAFLSVRCGIRCAGRDTVFHSLTDAISDIPQMTKIWGYYKMSSLSRKTANKKNREVI